MSLQYDEYLNEHIANVTKGLLWMQDNLGGTDSTALSRAIENAAHHDASKYDIEEYDAYDTYFYGRSFRTSIMPGSITRRKTRITGSIGYLSMTTPKKELSHFGCRLFIFTR